MATSAHADAAVDEYDDAGDGDGDGGNDDGV